MTIKNIVKDIRYTMSEIAETSELFISSNAKIQAVPAVLLENMKDACQEIVDNYESQEGVFNEAKSILLNIPDTKGQLVTMDTIALRQIMLHIHKMTDHII